MHAYQLLCLPMSTRLSLLLSLPPLLSLSRLLSLPRCDRSRLRSRLRLRRLRSLLRLLLRRLRSRDLERERLLPRVTIRDGSIWGADFPCEPGLGNVQLGPVRCGWCGRTTVHIARAPVQTSASGAKRQAVKATASEASSQYTVVGLPITSARGNYLAVSVCHSLSLPSRGKA